MLLQTHTHARVRGVKHTPHTARGPVLPGEAVGFGFIAYIDRGSAQVQGSMRGLYGCRVGVQVCVCACAWGGGPLAPFTPT